ncbi:AAA family ATPase [Flavobacterium gelatinilyticum]|uniref:AAA family ATPase n=1 Tax=Flavobacterium gelatinilyticum TaxID=3003260 RepID=UPI002480EDEF|nr:AAA family ATPase [Flavobacterium gelatinilyticum]
MSKIKNIKIDDFRIYKGSQEFSFSGTGPLSNLMVIYAPNGYGKTSFFDAVEWCYASKIRRFETDVLGHEINRRDYSSGDKILITNRQSFKEGRSGSVKISTDDQKVIERTATERKGVRVDFKYDYKTVSYLTSDYDQPVLDRLVKTNILTQDQIDEFLRHTKPDQRFLQLQNFWPEGENAISILRDLDSYVNMLQKEKVDLHGSITLAEQQIKDFLNAEDQILPLNKSIKDLTENSKTGLKIEELTNNVNKESYQAILATTQTYIERAKLIERNSSEQIAVLLNLQKDFTNYLLWKKNEPILDDNFSKLSELAKLHADLKSHKDVGKVLDTKLSFLLNSKQKLTRLLELIDLVDVVYKTISDQKEIVKNSRLDIDKHFHYLEGSRRVILELQSTLKDWITQRDSLDKSLSEWDTELQKYNFWKEETEKTTKKLKELNDSFEEKEAKISAQIDKRSQFHAIEEKRNYEYLPETDQEKLSKELVERNDILSLIITNKNEIEKLHSDLNKSTSLDETFERLITWGEEYVKNTDADHCPLCATKFTDVSILIREIEQQKSAVTATDKLKADLNTALASEKDLLEKLAVPNQKIALYIKHSLELFQNEITLLQTQRAQITVDISNTKNSLENSQREVKKSLSVLQPDLDETDNKKDFDFQKIKSDMQLKLLEISIKCKRLENIVQYRNNAISTLDNKISILKNKISTSENTIAISRADITLIEAEQIKSELNLPIDTFYKKILNSRLSDVTTEHTSFQNEKQKNIDKILEIQNNINASSVQISEADIPGLRLAKQDEIAENHQKINKYKLIFKSFSEISEPTVDFFTKELDKLQKYLDNVEAEVKDLEELLINLQVIEKNVLKNSTERDIKRWQEKIGPLDLAIDKVKNARTTSKKYINNEINNYFNQDVINQIYSRIEPHPNLNEIKINPKVTDKGPILDIKAVSNDEELDPSLYLSAGQLNVLSLSIFLANAFEKQSDEIDTIFMDDPIQNLSDINMLSFIDLIRTMITKYDRQIVISSHDENFYKLMRNKMPSDEFNVRYYEIESFGKARHIL